MKETIVIVAEGCHYCEELMKALPKEGIRILDVTKSLEAARLMRDLRLQGSFANHRGENRTRHASMRPG